MRAVLISFAALLPAVLGVGAGFRKTYTNNATLLRQHLLAGYDKVVPPESERNSISCMYGR